MLLLFAGLKYFLLDKIFIFTLKKKELLRPINNVSKYNEF